MHIHLKLGTRVMLYSLSILVIHRSFNYKQCMVYMQLMSKRDYTICYVCETHYTCLCSDPTLDGQVSVLKCHPWIGMLTHTVLEDL